MTEKKRVACFFTGGHTELNAMKPFMRKINSRVDYIQLCPIGERKSKDMIRGRRAGSISQKQSGRTGQALIDFVLGFIQTERFREELYDAILIEDDKDDRFLQVQPDGTASIDSSKWEEFEQYIRAEVAAHCPDIPVLLFLAAPEVEAWLLSDWDNSFGKIYRDRLTAGQNNYFSNRFRRHINEQILTQQYQPLIESYGYFDGQYRKLSLELQRALETVDFLEGYTPAPEDVVIRYSKRFEGEAMLEEIDPLAVARRCPVFFKREMLALKSL